MTQVLKTTKGWFLRSASRVHACRRRPPYNRSSQQSETQSQVHSGAFQPTNQKKKAGRQCISGLKPCFVALRDKPNTLRSAIHLPQRQATAQDAGTCQSCWVLWFWVNY